VKRAQRLAHIGGIGLDVVAAAAERHAASDPSRPVLRLENLDTNLPLPPEAIAETEASLGRPEANSWLPLEGDLDLRAAIADFTAARTGHRYDPETEIVITAGGLTGILDALLATTDQGDEIVVTDPTYAGIVNRIRLAGGTPVFAPFRIADGEWLLDREAFAAAVGPRTTGMVLMSPSMPSGGTFTREDWSLACDLCREHDLTLVYDAAMEALLYDGRELVHPLQFAGMAERTFVVGSLSKEHRMIGWRVGWVAGPPDGITMVRQVAVYNTVMPVALARFAAAAVLRGEQGHVAECVAELERRRDVLREGLAGWPLVSPGGGWSLLIDVESLGFTPAEASRILLEEAAIAATPMPGWGGPVAARCIRFVYSAEPLERLAEVPDRVAGTALAAAVAAR
jgi:aspartate/methionine/tyrosine aminotransferase